MGRAWNALWLTLAFLAELAALAALAYGAWQLPAPGALRVVAAPVAAAVLWGLFAAPRARIRSTHLATGVKVLVFGSAVVALAVTGQLRLAVLLAVVAGLSAALSTRPESPGRPAEGGPRRRPPARPPGGHPSG